jgi:WD40 repeat protein
VAESRPVLASGSQDGTVRLWSLGNGSGRVIPKQARCVFTVAFSPDGRLLAAGDTNGTIRLWSVPKLLAQKGKQ